LKDLKTESLKQVLMFGAGKSAGFLIEYLLSNAEKENWNLVLVDADPELAKNKLGDSKHGRALSFDINNEPKRMQAIIDADIVVSLLPPALHFIVAKDCVELKKDLLTASYVDEQIKSLQTEIGNNNLLFLCEMGLDPGIDHMSAMKMIDEIHGQGGRILSFRSHCGGLVSPDSDNNPWRYKISWNPRSVVCSAGRQSRGAL
jgi:saccharopine dehydrogenase-like NADP-dependent oxidoreductase